MDWSRWSGVEVSLPASITGAALRNSLQMAGRLRMGRVAASSAHLVFSSLDPGGGGNGAHRMADRGWFHISLIDAPRALWLSSLCVRGRYTPARSMVLRVLDSPGGRGAGTRTRTRMRTRGRDGGVQVVIPGYSVVSERDVSSGTCSNTHSLRVAKMLGRSTASRARADSYASEGVT